MDWTVIVSAFLGILAAVFGGQVLNVKGKLKQVIALGKEAIELAIVATDAIEDNTLEKSEVEAIKKEAAEVKGAWQALLGK